MRPPDRWKAAGVNAVALCKFACENWSFENAKATLPVAATCGPPSTRSTHQLFRGRSAPWAGASFECNCGGKLTFYEAENKGNAESWATALTQRRQSGQQLAKQTRSGQKQRICGYCSRDEQRYFAGTVVRVFES